MKNLTGIIVAGGLLLGLGACAGGTVGYSYYDDGRPYYHDNYRSGSYWNRTYRDRDGDGVPNRYDDYPRNPRLD
jgi:hypothetical protein